MINNQFVSLNTVIDSIKNQYLGSIDQKIDDTADCEQYFDVYWKNTIKSMPDLSEEIYIGEPCEINDDISDDELDYALLPQPVKDRGWWLLYCGEIVEDVISNALEQNKKLDNLTLLKAIDYYSRIDCFYDFIDSSSNVDKL